MNLQGRIFVAGTSYEELARLLPFARVLGQARGQRVILVGLVLVPTNASLSTGARAAMELRRALKPLLDKGAGRVLVRVTRDRWEEILDVLPRDEEHTLVEEGNV